MRGICQTFPELPWSREIHEEDGTGRHVSYVISSAIGHQVEERVRLMTGCTLAIRKTLSKPGCGLQYPCLYCARTSRSSCLRTLASNNDADFQPDLFVKNVFTSNSCKSTSHWRNRIPAISHIEYEHSVHWQMASAFRQEADRQLYGDVGPEKTLGSHVLTDA